MSGRLAGTAVTARGSLSAPALPAAPLRARCRGTEAPPSVPLVGLAPRGSTGPVIVDVVDLQNEDVTVARPRVRSVQAEAKQSATPAAGRLPVGRLAGLIGSGAFAFWTSLTCFVC